MIVIYNMYIYEVPNIYVCLYEPEYTALLCYRDSSS